MADESQLDKTSSTQSDTAQSLSPIIDLDADPISSSPTTELSQESMEPTAIPSVNNKPNFLPASDELLAHLEQQKKSAPSAKTDDSTPTATPPTDNSVQPATTAPDITPPANETNFNFAPIDQSAVNQTQSTKSTTAGNSFRPPQHVIDSLTDDQKSFINGASWAGTWSYIFLIAQNSLKHSLVAIFGSSIAIINIAVFFYYIKHARRIAWQSHYWDSFDSYQANMSKWSKWAKLYMIFVIVIMAIAITAAFTLSAINPQSRMAEASDSGRKSQLGQVASALEICYTAEASGYYANCDSLAKLTDGDHLSTTANVADIKLKTSADRTQIIAYTQLQATPTTCDIGSGKPAYTAYFSQTSQQLTVCGSLPTIEENTNPSSNKPSPTPTRTTVTPTSMFTR